MKVEHIISKNFHLKGFLESNFYGDMVNSQLSEHRIKRDSYKVLKNYSVKTWLYILLVWKREHLVINIWVFFLVQWGYRSHMKVELLTNLKILNVLVLTLLLLSLRTVLMRWINCNVINMNTIFWREVGWMKMNIFVNYNKSKEQEEGQFAVIVF